MRCLAQLSTKNDIDWQGLAVAPKFAMRRSTPKGLIICFLQLACRPPNTLQTNPPSQDPEPLNPIASTEMRSILPVLTVLLSATTMHLYVASPVLRGVVEEKAWTGYGVYDHPTPYRPPTGPCGDPPC
ncbi:hypothetical protein PtA15_7A553 [Puccinia triticina]|uniref:Uncharacterized protein n=1 Tax=Puccinia triticina TaxID=208348 RepID=A0ABY7CNT2_9BASI|nr:uncharacterized protein PtA15_7A553 [Puccinia triticina]WAQ86824.1 hypothetical protein PtA15_7A553 [Puccinia triticina]